MTKKLSGTILRYIILDQCVDGPTYGYALVSAIETLTHGHWTPSYGTIYPLVERMQKEGLLRELTSKEAAAQGLDDEDRNYVVATPDGTSEFNAMNEQKDETRPRFEDMLLGYLYIYREAYGNKAVENLFEQFNKGS